MGLFKNFSFILSEGSDVVDTGGTYLLLGQFYIREPNDPFPICSNNAGVTLTTGSPTTPCQSVDLSRDGSIKGFATARYYNSDLFRFQNGIVQVSNLYYCSFGGGFPSTPVKDWSWFKLSGDGLWYVARAGDGTLIYSTDSGENYSNYTTPIGYNISRFAISYNGQDQMFTLNPGSGTSPLVINSSNSGTTWSYSSTTTSSNYPNLCMMSYNTNIRMLFSNNGTIYKSDDGGITFTSQTLTIPGRTITGVSDVDMSDSGQIQYISITTTSGTTDNRMYYSYDYGNTWYENESLRNFNKIKTTAVGKIVYATNGSQIYKSIDFGQTFTFVNTAPNSSIADIAISRI